MSVDLDFSDIEKLQKRLDEIGRKGSILENKALLAGAQCNSISSKLTL